MWVCVCVCISASEKMKPLLFMFYTFCSCALFCARHYFVVSFVLFIVFSSFCLFQNLYACLIPLHLSLFFSFIIVTVAVIAVFLYDDDDYYCYYFHLSLGFVSIHFIFFLHSLSHFSCALEITLHTQSIVWTPGRLCSMCNNCLEDLKMFIHTVNGIVIWLIHTYTVEIKRKSIYANSHEFHVECCLCARVCTNRHTL